MGNIFRKVLGTSSTARNTKRQSGSAERLLRRSPQPTNSEAVEINSGNDGKGSLGFHKFSRIFRHCLGLVVGTALTLSDTKVISANISEALSGRQEVIAAASTKTIAKISENPQALERKDLQRKYARLDSIHVDITNIPEEILADSMGLSNAVANDGMDDSAVIQAAIDWITVRREAGLIENAVIYLPQGVFDLAVTLKVNVSNLTFEGAGMGMTILRNEDTFKVGTENLPDSGVDVSSVSRDAYLFSLDVNADNILFSGMTLTGPDIHGAIFGHRSDSLEIRDVKFNNFAWSSVRLFDSSDVKIHNNVFFDAGGRAKGTAGVTGGSIYATYLRDSEIYNNRISRSGDRPGNVYGIKGRQFRNTRIHHNTIDTNFSIELPFENDRFVEIDHNFLSGVISIPKFEGGLVPDDGFTFHIHHNYFTKSYSLEWARNGIEIDRNVFVFEVEKDGGNLISGFGSEVSEGPTNFHNNLILNPGRGFFWSRGVYNNFQFYNNHAIANETCTPRDGGLFGFNSNTDFSTVEIRDNIIQVNGIPRPLMRNEASYNVIIENNELNNISDINAFDNPNTASPRGLPEPLLFQVGVDGEFAVDSHKIISSKTASRSCDRSE